jgi:hypothetical protein
MSKETLSELKRCVQLFTNKVKGMSSRLPICKRIAQVHSGKIVMKGKVKKETMVTETISVEPEPTSENGEKWILNESASSTIIATRGFKRSSFIVSTDAEV